MPDIKENSNKYVEYVDEDLETWFDEHQGEQAIKKYIGNIDIKLKLKKVYQKVEAKKEKISKDIEKEERVRQRAEGMSAPIKGLEDKEKKKEKEKSVAKKDIKSELANMDSMIAYKTVLDDLHIEITNAYKRQIQARDLNPTEDEFTRMVELRQELVVARQNYKSEYKDEDLKYENDLKLQEESLDTELKSSLHVEIKSIDALQENLDDTLYEIEKLNYSIKHDEITYEEYQEQYEPLDKKRLELVWKISKQNPKLLEQQEQVANMNVSKEQVKTGVSASDIEKREVLNIDNINEKNIANGEYNPQENTVKNQSDSRKDRQEEFEEDEKEVVDDIAIQIEMQTDGNITIEAASNVKIISDKVRDIEATSIQDIDKDEVSDKSKSNKIEYSQIKEPQNKKEDSKEIASDVSESLVKKAVEAEYNEFISEELEQDREDGIVQTKDELHDSFCKVLSKEVRDPNVYEDAKRIIETLEKIDEEYQRAQQEVEKENIGDNDIE